METLERTFTPRHKHTYNNKLAENNNKLNNQNAKGISKMTIKKNYLKIAKAGMPVGIALCLLAGGTAVASASDEVVRDSVEVHFRVGKSRLEEGFGTNRAALDTILSKLRGDGPGSVSRIEIFGGASPEGPAQLNRRLSLGRAESLAGFISGSTEVPDSLITVTNGWWDWKGLLSYVQADPAVPDREQVLGLLEFVAGFEQGAITDREQAGYLRQLARLGDGAAYRYLSRNMFPKLRRSRMVMESELPPVEIVAEPEETVSMETSALEEMETAETECTGDMDTAILGAEERKPFYMALKTNLLYDALAVPELHAEFYLGKNWSVTAGGEYAWWSYDRRHRYWRIYGAEIGVRRWFGKAASRKPLTGHHLGVYGGAVTFDFEMGGEGYMGGKPGGTLRDRCLGYCGIEYGYSLPVARRLNIDFSIGVGYLGGRYIKYEPFRSIYHKTGEYRVSYFGPTKADISLVWLIGRGNTNSRKGGDR